MNLKHVLGDIQADHVDRFVFDKPPYGTSMPRAGAVHSINCCREQMQEFGGPLILVDLRVRSENEVRQRVRVVVEHAVRCAGECATIWGA
jgi:hypothetical protein